MKIPQNIQAISPYKAGKPIEELRRELKIGKIAKMASNENPLGPSRRALAAVRKYEKEVFRYPDASGHDLVQALSKHLQVPPARICVGNGSNELIELLTRSFLLPDDEVIMADPTFSLYRNMVLVARGVPVLVPLNSAYRHDLKGMAARVSYQTRMIFVCNPNNPTGTLAPVYEVKEFIREVPEDILIVFDHAYAEFVTDPSYSRFMEEALAHDNIFILRTFSKLYGLAGLRIGYGIGSESLVETINKVRQPFNTGLLAQKAAIAALSDKAHVKNTLVNNKTGKAFLYKCFEELGISYVPTEANFIYFEYPEARQLFDWMLREGIILRYLSGNRMRITIGKQADNLKFRTKLKKYIQTRKKNPKGN